MATLHGPRKVSAQLQVKIPRELARELRLDEGDEIYFRISDDDPGVLMVIPGEIVERRYQAGEAAEAAQREAAAPLDIPPVPGAQAEPTNHD